jgi:hypothetical protein
MLVIMGNFWIVFAFLIVLVAWLDRRYCMLRDLTTVKTHQPYSWSRVQLAWWSVIILSSFITVFFSKGVAPNLHMSTVILLGISSATTVTAMAIDVSDQQQQEIYRHQNQFGKNFFLDILSDPSGVSMNRLQTLAFNTVFGIWFISVVLNNMHADCSAYQNLTDKIVSAACQANPIDYVMPDISNNNLILLGLSSATYAAVKTTENKSSNITKDNTKPAESLAVTGNNTG